MSVRGKPSKDSPHEFARYLGLPVPGGTYLTWPALLDLAVEAYWQRRPVPAGKRRAA